MEFVLLVFYVCHHCMDYCFWDNLILLSSFKFCQCQTKVNFAEFCYSFKCRHSFPHFDGIPRWNTSNWGPQNEF